jgi:hypothetical protein
MFYDNSRLKTCLHLYFHLIKIHTNAFFAKKILITIYNVSRIYISRNVERRSETPDLYLNYIISFIAKVKNPQKKLLSFNSTEPQDHCEFSSNCTFTS